MTDSPDLLSEAREIVATVFEGRGGASAKCAPHVRQGDWDDSEEVEIALAALRRGMVLGGREP